MRKSVEHMGPQHAMVDLMITDSFILRVCPEFEMRRIAFMSSLLKQWGRTFISQAFPVGRMPSFRLGGRCYDQAAIGALTFGLNYCEGYLRVTLKDGSVFRMPHAWCCDGRGAIIDPTAPNTQDHPNVCYFGIPVQTPYLWAYHQAYGYHGMLDGHPELGDTVGPYVDDPKRWLAPI